MNESTSPSSKDSKSMPDAPRLVIEDLTEIICRHLPDGTFTYVNEAFCRFFGGTAHELLGSRWQPKAVPEDVPMIQDKLRTVSTQNPVVVIENRVYDAKGRVRWMQFVNRGLFEASGSLVEMQSVGRDITERVLAEQELKESQERWRFALESSGFGVWDWDQPSNSAYYSTEWKTLLGYDPADTITGPNEDWLGMVHPDDSSMVFAALQAHIDGRTSQYAEEFRLRCKDGTWKWVAGRGRIVQRDEATKKPRRMIGTIADISKRKAAEEREARSLQMIAEGAPCGAVLEAIVRNVEASHPGVKCSVMLADATGTFLRISVAPSLPDYAKEAIDGLPVDPDAMCCGAAVHSGTRVVCTDVLREPRMAKFHELAAKAKLLACWSEPVINSSGKVLGAFACYNTQPHEPDTAEIRTITNAARLAALAIEREWKEQALRISEERYARALRGTTDGLWDWNIATGDVYLSPRWKQMLGFEEHELPNSRAISFLDRLHPDDVPAVTEAREAHLEHHLPYQVELRLRTKSGQYNWFLVRAQAEWNELGEATRLTGTISDISRRKEAELNYLRELAYNQALVNHTSAFIVIMDVEGRFVHGNAAFFNTMGYPEKEVIGKTAWETGLMDDREIVRSKERFARLLRGEDNPPTDVRLRTKQGEWRTVELRSTSTRKPDGSPDRIIITGNDLTERDRLQRELLRVVEQEQTRIGHDLHDGVGQTMTGMLVMMEALEASLKGEHQEQAKRIHELMNESVSEVRRMSHGLSPTSVKYRGLVGALQLLAETVRTNFRTPCECNVDTGITIDSEEKQAHLFRIAQEAVNNALRHGKPGSVTINLSRTKEDECMLMIEDDGAGIMGGKASSKTGSNGIGMRVMEYRAHLIGARLKIEPRQKPKQGVVVTCWFACEPGEPVPQKKRTVKAKTKTGRPKKKE